MEDFSKATLRENFPAVKYADSLLSFYLKGAHDVFNVISVCPSDESIPYFAVTD